MDGAPHFLRRPSAVWANPVMIVWGSRDWDSVGGGRYDTTTNSWKPVNDLGAPSWRANQSAVWTGEEMIIWGGDREGSPLDTGGAYRLDLTAPAIICPADVNLECPAGAANIGRATASDACDPTPIITNDASPIMPLGAMVVDWTATDASGNRASCPERVNVRDTTPPGIAVVTSPSVLWPPNHRMMDVSASVAASDACGTTAVSLVSVNSTEPDDSPGTGDGNTVNDIQGPVPGSGGFNLDLRAHR